MRLTRSRAALPALLLVCAFWAVASRAPADTLTLTRPLVATCVTDDSAVFTVQNGELHAVSGQFMIFPPGSTAFRPRTELPSDGEPGPDWAGA